MLALVPRWIAALKMILSQQLTGRHYPIQVDRAVTSTGGSFPVVHGAVPHVPCAYRHKKSGLHLTAIVARLQEVLGRDVVAIITGKTPRQVSQWVAGEAKPPVQEQRLWRDTF